MREMRLQQHSGMNPSLHFDTSLLRRYDRPGPRYTSYPTAPQFTDAFKESEFRTQARASNDDPIPRQLSLYVHVPFCFSPCFYCGCNKIITRDLKRAEPYLQRLIREAALLAPLFDRDREVVQLHLGGGTPNFMDVDKIATLVDSLAHHFHFSSAHNRDFSIELDPRSVKAGDIAELARLGFNRASLGVQDFDPIVQAAVNRIQSVAETLAVIQDCRNAGFRSINVDLIYGLPKQSMEGFARTLDTLIEVRPERLAIYSYAHLPTMFRPQTQILADDLPSADVKLALLQLAIEKLSAAGYRYIGMDHFALPTDALAKAQQTGTLHRNFMGYTTHGATDLIGLGVSSISHVGESYSQNPRDLPGYEAAIDAGHLAVWRGMCMSGDDVVRSELIQQLMCQGEINMLSLEQRYRINFIEYFQVDMVRLAALAADDLVHVTATKITATARGRLLLRSIAACFDFYLHAPKSAEVKFEAKRFSRAI
jgi:oxygen-independent coproporphyrinogen III oxidase